MFGVFDGAGSVTPWVDEKGYTGGYKAAIIARTTFNEGKGSLTELALQANEEIQKSMLTYGIDTSKKQDRWGTTAAVVQIDGAYAHSLQITDSCILIVNKDGSYRLQHKLHDHDLPAMRLAKKYAAKQEADIWSKIKAEAYKIRQKANVTWGSINGEQEMGRFLQCSTFSLENVAHILLLTDGLFTPKEDPEAEEDFSGTIKLFQQGGLERIADCVFELENADPNCWRYPRYKQHDDKTAVAVSFI